MPRKQNGFGTSKSLSFKGSGRVDKGKGLGAPGTYPRRRGYGSSVTRTVIEKWNLDSEWTRWRNGYEIWNQAFYSVLRVINPFYDPGKPQTRFNPEYVVADLDSILYQGTDFQRMLGLQDGNFLR